MEQLHYSDVPLNIQRELDEAFEKNDKNPNPRFTVDSFLKEKGIKLIEEGQSQNTVADNGKAKELPFDNSIDPELSAISEIINTFSESNEYNGKANWIESGNPGAAKLYGPDNHLKMEEFRDKALLYRKNGMEMLNIALKNGLLEKYGFFKPKDENAFSQIAIEFENEFMGPAKPNVARRRKISRQVEKMLKNEEANKNS